MLCTINNAVRFNVSARIGPERTYAQQTGQYEQVSSCIYNHMALSSARTLASKLLVVSFILSSVQSNLLYDVPSVMSAVDMCLKAYILVNLHYCHGAGSSWLFVQKAVYYILTDHDNSRSKVLLLLADINFRRNAIWVVHCQSAVLLFDTLHAVCDSLWSRFTFCVFIVIMVLCILQIRNLWV